MPIVRGADRLGGDGGREAGAVQRLGRPEPLRHVPAAAGVAEGGETDPIVAVRGRRRGGARAVGAEAVGCVSGAACEARRRRR